MILVSHHTCIRSHIDKSIRNMVQHNRFFIHKYHHPPLTWHVYIYTIALASHNNHAIHKLLVSTIHGIQKFISISIHGYFKHSHRMYKKHPIMHKGIPPVKLLTLKFKPNFQQIKLSSINGTPGPKHITQTKINSNRA